MNEFATQGSSIAPPTSAEDSQQESMVAAEPVVMPVSNVSAKPSASASTPQAGALAQSVGGWVHRHKNLPQGSVLGFGAYQYVRSAIASIPYGVSMALTLLGLTKMGMVGDAMAAKPSAGTVTKTVGQRMSQLANFTPIRTAAMVATSFTLYRGTSKLVKWLTEYLFNPKDSEARTIEKVRDLPHETVRKIKEIAPAEVSSTPVAALVLGFVTAGFNKGGYPVINKETKHWGIERINCQRY